MLSSQSGVIEPIWVYPKEDQSFKERISKEFNIHPVTAQILVSRGFTTLEDIHAYLYSRLPDLHDPFLMSEMQQAVVRIHEAIAKKENILIYGDNDVDGMTGTALLTEFLQQIGANVFYYLSNRSMRRQSLIIEALEYALKNQCKLVITVDCGITAAAEIAKLAEHNVDVIITDHHEPTDKIPHCIATLNPKLLNNSYPNRDLTGVGVAFKLAHAITNHQVEEGRIASNQIDLKTFLDLVALGTISDMGSLLGENRILVGYGLKQLRNTKRVGLLKLISVANVDMNDLSTYAIASKLAPRLNSLGRIADPSKGVELLLIRNPVAAEKLALELDLNNIERQKIEKTMITDVENILSLHPEFMGHKAIVLESDKWHPGIIAILSTRVSKHYNRPAVMIAIDKEIAKGSLRSIPEFPLLDLLKESSDILLNFGGHDFAAGMTMKVENINEFKRRFIEAADKTLNDRDVIPKLHIDAKISFQDLTFDFMESVKLLEPFGNENPPPILYTEARQAWAPKVISKNHLKMYLEQNDQIFEGIAFDQALQAPALKRKEMKDKTLLVAFTPQINNFQGPSIQFIIRGFKV